jgi:SPP1 gp7 family putative phage head morphogenesis protein
MILPSGFEFHLETPSNQVAFADAIMDENKAIAKGLLVPNLLGVTEQGDTGSYSQSSTQLEAFLWTLDADGARLEEALNEQLFRELGEVNFADGVYPKFRFKPLSDHQRNEVIRLWKDLVQGGAATNDLTSENHVRELLEFPERDEDTAPVPGEEPGGTPPREPSEEEPPATGEEPPGGGTPSPESAGETVAGKTAVTVGGEAFQRALKRVAFAKIDHDAEVASTAGVAEAAQEMDTLLRDVVVRLEQGELTEAEAVNQLKLDGRGKRRLRTVLRKTLKEGWGQGVKQAGSEVDKAKGEAFTVKQMDKERLFAVGEEYLDAKSFEMAGNLSEAALATVKGVLLQGIKNSKPNDVIRQEIYTALAREGFISSATAEEELGELIDYKNPSARLDTVVRTNLFEAINEGRWGTFTDPALGGFVQAFDYSAILDRRTTQVCRHLDGKTYGASSEVWSTQGYRPPNHYNCRSLLVAVTERDTWTESDPPEVEPQTGFD